MTQPWSPPIRSVLQGNADHGGDYLVPRTAFFAAAKFASPKNSVTHLIDRAPTHPNTAPCHRIPNLHEPVEQARSGSDRRAAPYNPHNGLWRAV